MARATRKKKSIKRNSRKRTPKNTRRKKHKKTMYGGAGFMKALAQRLKERTKRRKRKAGKTRGSKPPPILRPSEFSSNNEEEENANSKRRYKKQMNNEKKQYNEHVESWRQQWTPYTLLKDPNYVYGWEYYNVLKPYWTTKDIFGREVAIYTKPERAIEPGYVIKTGEGDGPWTKVEKDHQHAGGIIPADTKIITIDRNKYLTTLRVQGVRI